MLESLAPWIGRHPLETHGVLLLGALALALLAWMTHTAARRRWTPWVEAAPGRRVAVLVGSLLLGAAVIVLAGAAFAEVAEHLSPDGRVARFDDAVTASVRDHVGPRTLQAYAWISHAGDTLTLTGLGLVVAVLLWRRGHRLLAWGWSLGLAGNGLLTRGLKSVFERVRPVHEHGLAVADGWSFPSGHTSGSLVAYGLLAYVALRHAPPAWRLPAVLAAAALAVTIGWSRVVLQVHYASDVVAGWLSGGAWLAACVMALEAARRAHHAQQARRAGPAATAPGLPR